MTRKSTALVRRAALAITTVTLASLALAAPAPAAAAKPGNYKGKTEQGLPVQFEVSGKKVGNLYFKVRRHCPGDDGTASWLPGDPSIHPDQGYGTPGSFILPDKIERGKFRLKNRFIRSVPPIKGEFVTKRKAEGQVHYGCASNGGDITYKTVSLTAKHV